MRPSQSNSSGPSKAKGPHPPAASGKGTQNPRHHMSQPPGAPSFLMHAPQEALRHQLRPSTITVARWDDVCTRDLTPREFTHGFSRIGIDNQGPLLFEVDQRHLLFLVKQFNDLLLDGEQLMRRTKLNPFGDNARSTRGAAQVDPLARRGFAAARDAPPRVSSLNNSVFRVGGANFIAEASQEMLNAQLRSQRREDGVLLASQQHDASGDLHSAIVSMALLSKYEPSELQAQLCGVPPIAALSMRFRLSPWRSLFETWIVALAEERRPSATVVGGVAATARAGHRQPKDVDLCWKSVRPQRAHSRNVDCIVELEMLVQLAFRVADLEQLSNSISLGGMLQEAPQTAASITPPATAASTFNATATLGPASDPRAPRKQAIRAKALAYERMIAPPRGVPHLICTATAVYALSEYLVPLFGDCAPFVKVLLNTILPLMLHPAARQTVSNAMQVHALGPQSCSQRPQECAVRYVQCTYAHELTQHLPLLTVVKHRTRDKVLLRHRQDGMITSLIKGVMFRFIQSLFQQWRNITRRHRSLKAAIGQVLVSTSNTEVIRRSIGRWSFMSKAKLHGADAAHDARGKLMVPPVMLHRLSIHAVLNASGRSHHGAQMASSPDADDEALALNMSLSETQLPNIATGKSSPSSTAAANGRPTGIQLRATSPPPCMPRFVAPSPPAPPRAHPHLPHHGTAHPISYPFSPLIRAASQMAVQSAFSPLASPRGTLNRSSRGGGSESRNMEGSIMSAASTPRAGGEGGVHASPTASNIWEPKTPSEKHKRTALLASGLHAHVMHRNAIIAKFEYTERQALIDRLATLDDAIREYTKAAERVGLQFRTAMDALFPLIPSPLGWDDGGEGSLRGGGEGLWTGMGSGGGDSVGRRTGVLTSKQFGAAEIGGDSPKTVGDASSGAPQLIAPGQHIEPIDMTVLNAAGLEARRSVERVAAAAAALTMGDGGVRKPVQANQHKSLPGGRLPSLTTASSTAVSLQEAEQLQNQEIMRRQDRIFHWLMHLAKHDVAASGNRLSTYLHRCCNERASSLSLSVVARSTHLLPVLRVLLLVLVPPSLPHFQLVDLFSEALLQNASTEPPRQVLPQAAAATMEVVVDAGQQPHSPPSSTVPSTLNSVMDIPLLLAPRGGTDINRRQQNRRKSSVNFAGIGERPEEHMPELREEQEALERRQSEHQQGACNSSPTRRRSSNAVVGFSPLDAGLQPPLPFTEDGANSSLSGKSPLTEDLNAAVRGSIFGGGGRRRSLMAKLNVVTMRAAQHDEENSGETFSKRYIRRQSVTAGNLASNVGDVSEAVLMHRRKSVEIHQEKTPASIASMESAALGMVLEHRKGFLGTLSGAQSMFSSMPEEHGPQGNVMDLSATTAEERQQLLKAQEAEALQREEEQQISAIGEEMERAAREKEFAEVLKGILECCDVTSVTHLVLKLTNRLLKRSTVLSNATSAPGGVSTAHDDDRVDYGQMTAAARFLHEQNLLRSPSKQAAGPGPSGHPSMGLRVFPSLLSRHLVLKHNNWRHVLMAALYYTQVGPTCMAFRNIYTGIETRARKPLKSLTTEERYEIILGTRKPVDYFVANSEVPPHDPLPTTPQEMHQLCNARRQRKRDTGLDVEEVNALTMFHDAARDVSLKAFYGVGLTTTAGQVYDQFCAASPDIADASFILPSFMAQKMRIVFGAESSFWKPVTSVRLLKSSKELEDVVTTLAPLARISPQDLCDRLLASLDDMDLFFVSLSSAEVEDAYTACFPEITVVFSLFSSGDPMAPSVSYENWMAMNQPLCDANYTMAMADTIYNTVARRLYNQRVQEKAIATGAVSVFQLNQSLLMHTAVVPAAANGSVAADTSSPMGAGAGAAGMLPTDVCRVVQLDLDSFCDALSVLASMKFPNPFTPLEQKVVPFVQTLLVPLVGAKSKDMRRRMQGGCGDAVSKKDIRRATAITLDDLSFELRTKITMIRDKQRYHSRATPGQQ